MDKSEVDAIIVKAFDEFQDEHPEFAKVAKEMSFYYDPDDNVYAVTLSCAMAVEYNDATLEENIRPIMKDGFVKIFEHMKKLFNCE